MDHPLPLLSVPIERVTLARNRPERIQPTAAEEHALRASVHKHGILEPLLVCEDGRGGYEVIDGERRFSIAKNSGMRRLVVVIHPFIADREREEFRLEIKKTVSPFDEGVEATLVRWVDSFESKAA